MTEKKVAPKPVIKKVAPKKKAPRKKTVESTGVDANAVVLEEYSMEMTIPTGQYANIRPRIVVKAYSMDKAHDFMAPHMNKLWKEYYLINERRPEPVKVPTFPKPNPEFVPVTSPSVKPIVTGSDGTTSPAPPVKPFVPEAGSGSTSKPLPGGTTTSTGGLGNSTYLKDPKPPAPDTKLLTFDQIKDAIGGKEIFPDEDKVTPPASSVALLKATQAIESCLSMDALEIISAQVDKSVKLTAEDKEVLQPLLLSRSEKLSNAS